MNSLYRRLVYALLQNGGTLQDADAEERFRAFIRTHVALLPPRLRRTVELVLEADERVSYEDLATLLSHEEGRRVATATVRQRVSRGGRVLEHAVRMYRDRLVG